MWVQSKGLNVRPSDLYGIENRLAAFIFDRGIYQFGTLVESKMSEAEARVKGSFQNRRGAEVFINLERRRIFNKMLDIQDTKGLYRDVSAPKAKSSNLFGS